MNKKWVPIPCLTTQVDNHSCSFRRQIPITPQRALTYWKSQGLSLEQLMIRINRITNGREKPYQHSFGALFTAISHYSNIQKHISGLEYTDVRFAIAKPTTLFDFLVDGCDWYD